MNFFNLNKNGTSSCINTLNPIVPPPLFNEEKKHKPNSKCVILTVENLIELAGWWVEDKVGSHSNLRQCTQALLNSAVIETDTCK